MERRASAPVRNKRPDRSGFSVSIASPPTGGTPVAPSPNNHVGAGALARPAERSSAVPCGRRMRRASWRAALGRAGRPSLHRQI